MLFATTKLLGYEPELALVFMFLSWTVPARVPSVTHGSWLPVESWAEKISLLLVGRSQEARFRGRQLGEDFAELPKLDETGIRIVAEITFRQCPQPLELGIVSF